MCVCVCLCRGVGRIFKGGFHDPSARLMGRGYATCVCAYWLDESSVCKRGSEAIIYFTIIETAVSANRHGAQAGVRECH